jgi:hypothetical protein
MPMCRPCPKPAKLSVMFVLGETFLMNITEQVMLNANADVPVLSLTG